MGARPLKERRRSGRPRNGDAKLCPKCGAASCEFNERYRFDGIGIAPGWVCDSPRCHYRELARAGSGGAAQRSSGKRQVMKRRPLAERSRKRLPKSDTLATKRR